MTFMRLISLPLHSALELLAGLALLVVGVALGFSPAGLIVAVALGALLVGLAFAGSSPDRDWQPLAVHRHLALDRLAVIGALVASIALAAAGDRLAAQVLAAVAAGQLALSLTTRYVGAGT